VTRPGRLLAALVAVAALSACRTGRGKADPTATGLPSTPAGEGEQPWFAGTPKMQAEIRDLVARIQGADDKRRVEIARRLAEIGEPSVPVLVETVVHHHDPVTRGIAAYVLGFMRDARALTAIRQALADPDPVVRLEASAAALRLGDDHGLEAMVAGLEDPDPRIRLRCIMVLRDTVGDTFGYRADDDPLDRSAAVARWRAWLERRRSQQG
jgi:HEAT repeat protein